MDKEKISKTILLVEDEIILSMTEKMSLAKYGYTVITANTGEKAIETITAQLGAPIIDLILMDIDLGEGLDGTEIAALILKDFNIPIVFLSSHNEDEIVEKTEKITSYGYVLKNSSITVLDASIKMAFKLFEANKKIAESEAKQKALIANISDVIAIINVDGIIQYISPNIEKWFQWLPENLVGQKGSLTVHPDDLERTQKEFNILLQKNNESMGFEYRYKCKDGTYKSIDLTATNLVHDPLIRGILLNYHDITKRKIVEDNLLTHQIELQMQNEELRCNASAFESLQSRYFELYDMAPSAYFTLDSPGQIIEANLTAAALLGLPRGELFTKKFNTFILEEDQDKYYFSHIKLIKTGEMLSEKIHIKKTDGSVFLAYVKGTQAQNVEGASIYRIVVLEIEKKDGLV